MLTLLFISVSLFLLTALLFKFLTCDGDFTLISKKHAKREEIEDKVFWVTGASRGIGEILAKQLATLGAKLILYARNEAELERVKSQLKGKHAPHDVKILPLDLASGEESLREAVEKAEAFFPGNGVDYMVHNAAYERPMSSTAGKTPAPGQAIYSASKFALNGYFHSLRSELFQKGIKVTVVCPGPIETSNGCTTSSGKTEEREDYVSVVCILRAVYLLMQHQCRSLASVGCLIFLDSNGMLDSLVTSERCAELVIIGATHDLKEVWISRQAKKETIKQAAAKLFLLLHDINLHILVFLPVLSVMYLVQYIPSIGYWLMDRVGENRVAAAAQKGDTYSLGLLFGKKKAS